MICFFLLTVMTSGVLNEKLFAGSPLRSFFQTEIFPVLTPLAFDPAHPFPHISNLSLNLAVVVHDPEQGERFARLKVPDTFPRLLPIVGGVVKVEANGQ